MGWLADRGDGFYGFAGGFSLEVGGSWPYLINGGEREMWRKGLMFVCVRMMRRLK